MSAWIVDTKNIDRIVTYILRERSDRFNIFKTLNPNKMGQKIWKLNHDAVNQRYNEQVKCPKYEYKIDDSTIYQQLMSLGCLLYQCSEGNVPKRKLYKYLKKLENEMSYEIVSKLKEFKDTKWE